MCQQWTGIFFGNVSLKSLPDFTVVDISGIHSLKVFLCSCMGAATNPIQLLQLSWFPGSCFTLVLPSPLSFLTHLAMLISKEK